jgi:cytochrome c oxidase cbb3-type subunit 3
MSSTGSTDAGGGNIDRERDHSFDGITEYDNDLPRWWLAMLWISVVFAIWYVAYFHFGNGQIGVDRWTKETAAIAAERAKHQTGPLTEESLRALSHDPERIARGKTLFGTVGCSICHGPEGTGLIGPNLCDRYWIYGSNMTDIVEGITNGRANNVMPPQKAALSPDDINNLAIYVVSLSRAGFKPGKPADLTREKDNPITY